MRLTLLLAVATLAVSLAGAELALRLARPLWAIPYPPVCYRPDLFQRWDPYGYRLWPSRTMQARYPGPDGRLVTIVSNRDGFRSRRELHEADGRRRVVVLGDSMVFGVGVEEAERCTEVLEALEPGWRVDNLGMVGYGPDLMLRALEAVGLDPPPGVVVLVIFSHDVYRVAPEVPGVGFPLPRFVLRSGRLTTVPYPERPAWQRLFLVQGLRYVSMALHERGVSPERGDLRPCARARRAAPLHTPLAVGTSASAAGVRAIPEAYPRASGTLTLY